MRTFLGQPLRGPALAPRAERRPADRPTALAFRIGEQTVREAAPKGELAREPALAWVEAALLAANEPLPPRKLAAVAYLADAAEARRLVRRLQLLYDQGGSAFQVEELAGGFQLLTRAQYHSWLVRLRRGNADIRLSAALRETLAIIAYRQPVVRADVEGVRGVHVGEALRQLMEKGLVRIVGRDGSLGRPVLYGTTKKFLQVFGLKSLRDLPEVAQLRPPEKTSLPEEEGS
jgi:segregation and condensation protein B